MENQLVRGLCPVAQLDSDLIRILFSGHNPSQLRQPEKAPFPQGLTRVVSSM